MREPLLPWRCQDCEPGPTSGPLLNLYPLPINGQLVGESRSRPHDQTDEIFDAVRSDHFDAATDRSRGESRGGFGPVCDSIKRAPVGRVPIAMVHAGLVPHLPGKAGFQDLEPALKGGIPLLVRLCGIKVDDVYIAEL